METTKAIEKYKTTICKEMCSKWVMDTRQVWQRDSVKAAFHEVHEFLTTKVAADTPTSSLDLDVELMGILEKHRSAGGGMAKYQAIFVALLLETMTAKEGDLCAKKPSVLLTHGYRCHLLSYLLAQLLGEATLGPLITLYRTSTTRDEVLSYFDV